MNKNYTIKFYRKSNDSKYAKVYINDTLYCRYVVLSEQEVDEYFEDDEMFHYDEHFKIGDKYYQTYIDIEIMEYYICEIMKKKYNNRDEFINDDGLTDEEKIEICESYDDINELEG